ncbi:TNFAIP3-interacting protein 2 [Denticeps clupeoides]|uniref:TNFAIP3-interacting protein 2 n=1 Tax=Denticeps clupeoides TaxID=299321 RepID=A0AAY4C4Z1_9TELE|nr:TNFAIP3-interacting protein 2 [Denticeps clupeoides]
MEDAAAAQMRSCSTLNTFCHETQREIGHLRRQLLARDSAIADLKARLGKYERTVVHAAEGEEPVAVGPSRSLLESLCGEICKLKKKLKESEVKAQEQLEARRKETESLQSQMRDKEEELDRVVRQPDHEKDLEIKHLRSALAERDRVQATRAVLCNTLAEDADKLRVQLGATMRVCQELLDRLEKEKKKGGRSEEQQVKEARDPSETVWVNEAVLKLEEENKQLKSRVDYVEKLNSNWQKYDASREEYVRRLCQKLKESSGVGGVQSKTGLLQQEIVRLNCLLEDRIRECERLAREREDRSKEDQEHIQMLKQQVLAYIEDFKSERADRERAQSKILDLQEEVARLQLQIRKQSPKEASKTCQLHPFRKKSSKPRTEVVNEALLASSADQASSRRVVGMLSASGSTRTECRGTGEIQCPSCFIMYDDAHTTEYMKHLEECGRL